MPGIRFSSALFLALFLSGCGGRSAQQAEPVAADPARTQSEQSEQAVPREPATPLVAASRHERFWLPPLFASQEDEVHYYISRLADRRFIDVYGGTEHPRVWYIAAERLGQIGEPAVPLLFTLLDTGNEYELMLALYALQLATQDPRLMARTGGDYVRLTTALDENANAENRRIALEWWQRHGWRLR
ncbi:hypothetical protein [Billgrantia lactosivorans]|uniref:hypothetical protein n=1 Tax=Billgrantia lactosivorans TaxID=2185141 RepID=UPI000DADDDEA|nr:hypothetical protein [Halomonas lactosivorans]